MSPHQQRVVDEKTELDAKLEKLNIFLGGPVFKTLPADEKGRLMHQANLMHLYSNVLGKRIEHFDS